MAGKHGVRRIEFESSDGAMSVPAYRAAEISIRRMVDVVGFPEAGLLMEVICMAVRDLATPIFRPSGSMRRDIDGCPIGAYRFLTGEQAGIYMSLLGMEREALMRYLYRYMRQEMRTCKLMTQILDAMDGSRRLGPCPDDPPQTFPEHRNRRGSAEIKQAA